MLFHFWSSLRLMSSLKNPAQEYKGKKIWLHLCKTHICDHRSGNHCECRSQASCFLKAPCLRTFCVLPACGSLTDCTFSVFGGGWEADVRRDWKNVCEWHFPPLILVCFSLQALKSLLGDYTDLCSQFSSWCCSIISPFLTGSVIVFIQRGYLKGYLIYLISCV